MKLASLSAAGLLIPFLAGCASLSAEPFSAQVVDADTGQAISGVVVMAYWELHGGSLTGHSLSCGAVNIEEDVTDQDGRFHIHGWGPVMTSCDMRAFNPSVTAFKFGYYPETVNNDPLDSLKTVWVSRSVLDGKAIKLRKYPNMDLSERAQPSYGWEIYEMSQNMKMFVVNYPAECNWKKMPNMLRAIWETTGRLKQEGNNTDTLTESLTIYDRDLQNEAPKCGSPKAFIEGLLK